MSVRDVIDRLRLRDEHRRELLDRFRMTLDVLLEIHVDEIRRQRADFVDARILRPADARPFDAPRERCKSR